MIGICSRWRWKNTFQRSCGWHRSQFECMHLARIIVHWEHSRSYVLKFIIWKYVKIILNKIHFALFFCAGNKSILWIFFNTKRAHVNWLYRKERDVFLHFTLYCIHYYQCCVLFFFTSAPIYSICFERLTENIKLCSQRNLFFTQSEICLKLRFFFSWEIACEFCFARSYRWHQCNYSNLGAFLTQTIPTN